MPKAPPPFHALDAYLSADRSPENCMQLSDLDGFLTALAVGPETIPEAEWLPEVWAGDTPKFRTAREGEQVIAAIRARYQEIVAGLDQTPPVVMPVFWISDGYPIVADWAEGFLDGVKLRAEQWSQLIGAMGNAILIPLAVYWGDDEGEPLIHVDDDVRERIDTEAPELIPVAVVAIRDYWRARKQETAVRLH